MSTHAAEDWAKSPQATPSGAEQKPAVYDYSDVLGGETRTDRAWRTAKHLEWLLQGMGTPQGPGGASSLDFVQRLATEVRQLLDGDPVDVLDDARRNLPRVRAEIARQRAQRQSTPTRKTKEA